MKTIVKLVISVLIATAFTSCVVPVQRSHNRQGYSPQQGYGQQGRQTRHLDSVTVTKVDTGKIGVRTKNATPEQRASVKRYTIDQYQKTGRVPSNEVLSQRFGFPVQTTGFQDTPDRKVGSVTVGPNEVPESIRRRFQ